MNNDKGNNKKDDSLAALEALLFIYGEPLSFEKIGESLKLDLGEVESILNEFKRELARANRGLDLIILGNKAQLVTKSHFSKLLENFVKEEISADLTPASLEVLAIISYLGPISRSRIEYLRGVNSSFTLRNLMLRGLIERSLDPSHPNSYVYQPTFEFFKHIGISQKENLPDFEKFQSLLKIFEIDNQDQADKSSLP